jgi:nitrate/nitrite transporter NarK
MDNLKKWLSAMGVATTAVCIGTVVLMGAAILILGTMILILRYGGEFALVALIVFAVWVWLVVHFKREIDKDDPR